MRVPPAIGVVMIVSAVAVLAGGGVHLHDWLVTYRHLPASFPGSAVVRVGFPLNVVASLIAAGAVAVCAFRPFRFTPLVIAGAFVFQLSSLASLVLTRTGSLFGWSEPAWTSSANRTRIVEIVALLTLAAAGCALAAQRSLTDRVVSHP